MRAQKLAKLVGVAEEPTDNKNLVVHDPNVARMLIPFACILYAAQLALIYTALPASQPLGSIESVVVQATATMQMASVLLDLCTKRMTSLRACVCCVKCIACVTNILILTTNSPFVVDPVTGRPNSMLRWAEWITLSFTMTFLVEAVDSKDLWVPITTGATQCLSTACGPLMPLCNGRVWPWAAVCTTSYLLFSWIYVRYIRKQQELAAQIKVNDPTADLASSRLGVRLLFQCVLTWTALVAVWTADLVATLVWEVRPATDWAFIGDCVIDLVAKVLYNTAIQEQAENMVQDRIVEERRVLDERVRMVWNDASDVLIVSQRVATDTFVTAASPAVRKLLSKDLATEWIAGKQHGVKPPPALSDASTEVFGIEAARLPSFVCGTLESLVACAWEHSNFTVVFGKTSLEASVTESSDDLARVVCLRNVTDRIRAQEAEKQLLSTKVARERDDEANRFNRHEVKNCIIASMERVKSIQSIHKCAVSDGQVPAGTYANSVESLLDDMDSSLSQTLETVLMQAMAREVCNGVYQPRPAPAKVDDVLRNIIGMDTKGIDPVVVDGRLPTVSLDVRLLQHIFRNAHSNARKYGRKNAVVRTVLSHSDQELTMQVINERGEHHERLVNLEDHNVVFRRGLRFHKADPTQNMTSNGDGAWVMQQCANALGGSVSIAFLKNETVFSCSVPAPEAIDESFLTSGDVKLGDCAFGLAIDDCEFQRMIIENIFNDLGISQMVVLGESQEEIESFPERLVSLLKVIPAHMRVIAIVDENLDVPGSSVTLSGSYLIQQAREQLKPADEGRLLAVVRSANDSPRDIDLYTSRAHGFLTKAPIEPDRISLLRQWAQRFGTKQLFPQRETVIEDMTMSMRKKKTHRAAKKSEGPREAAKSELTKSIAHVQELYEGEPGASREIEWAETWKQLHRIKGTVLSVRACGWGSDPTAAAQAADKIIRVIESFRTVDEYPKQFGDTWEMLTKTLLDFMIRGLS